MITNRRRFGLIVLVTFSFCFSFAAQSQGPEEREVTLTGIVAVPGSKAIDAQLMPIAAQLRKLLPGHGFMLLESRSARLATGNSFKCDFKNGYLAESELVDWGDPNGKVQIRFTLSFKGTAQLTTVVVTPPNQLSFCDKKLADGSRLLVAIGAR